MSYDKDSGFTVDNKALTQFLLDEVVSGQVYVSSGFVKHNNLGLQKHGSTKTKKLLLPHGKEVVALRTPAQQALLHGTDMLVQLDLLQDFPDFSVRLLLKRIQVLTDSALNQEGRLRDVGNLLSKQVQANS